VKLIEFFKKFWQPILGMLGVYILFGAYMNDFYLRPHRAPVAIAWTAAYESPEKFAVLKEAFYPLPVTVEPFVFGGDVPLDVERLAYFATLVHSWSLDIVIGDFVHNEETGAAGIRMTSYEMLMDLRPVFAAADVTLSGAEIRGGMAVSLEGNRFLSDLGFDTDGLYLGVFDNNRREARIHQLLRVLWDAA